MNRKLVFATLLLAGGLTLTLGGIAHADDDDYGEREWGRYGRSVDVPPVANSRYAAECGSCHFAYQPGWLPARSWRQMMGNLGNHFGENAELDAATRDAITGYLVEQAADTQSNRMSRRILASLKADEAPQRISELRFMRREHDEIPARMVEKNPKVGSRSSCQACHTQAAAGIFNEHGVNIPGFGRFED